MDDSQAFARGVAALKYQEKSLILQREKLAALPYFLNFYVGCLVKSVFQTTCNFVCELCIVRNIVIRLCFDCDYES